MSRKKETQADREFEQISFQILKRIDTLNLSGRIALLNKLKVFSNSLAEKYEEDMEFAKNYGIGELMQEAEVIPV